MKRNTENGKRLLSLWLVSILIFVISLSVTTPAFAAYLISFKSAVANITTPTQNGERYDGVVSIEGSSQLAQIWLCVRSPKGEVTTYPVDVVENHFQYDLYLRFGAGTYTIWVGDSSQHFDGKIRFEVVNTADRDLRYTTPSAYVDSNNEKVTQLVNSLIRPEMTEDQKLEAIYQWVTENISYDYNAYLNNSNKMKKASSTIEEKKGTCRDYSFTVAALARAAGLEAKVVYGPAQNGRIRQYHAWNEIKINNQWVSVDSTWDAGYVKNGTFTFSPQRNYYKILPTVFSKTHQVDYITLH
mgnify:CR=1 FL=1